jgi:DNA modification methylase
MKSQNIPLRHIILWNNVRQGRFLYPDSSGFVENPDSLLREESDNYRITNIILDGLDVQGAACGSAFRSVGLMAANTPLVTFADDDVFWEDNHLSTMLEILDKKALWGFCKRIIWKKNPEGGKWLIGIDNFESVGERAKTPYKMVDNNCMVFNRRLGSSAAVLYRETTEYNDDRLMYNFLKKYGGDPYLSDEATVNQICPEKLEEFFTLNCDKVVE